MRGTFELAGEQAVDEVFGLILRRIDWMDEKGIRQWNVTGYAEAYPKTHYQDVYLVRILNALYVCHQTAKPGVPGPAGPGVLALVKVLPQSEEAELSRREAFAEMHLSVFDKGSPDAGP